MPFDPALPAANSNLESAVIRSQLTALKALIDAVPAGPPGADGAPREPGPEGAQGPPFANAVVDNVNTVAPGDPAAVSVSFDGTDVHFSFDIPAGVAGNDGAPGADGADGAPGEVSAADLTAAIAGTSGNSNGVSTLGLSVSDPPTQGEIQSVADKLDELINALRR